MNTIAPGMLEAQLLKECEEIEAFKWGTGCAERTSELGDYDFRQYETE